MRSPIIGLTKYLAVHFTSLVLNVTPLTHSTFKKEY